MLYESDNQAFLDAAGYDPSDPGEDIILPPWSPSAASLASFRRRDAQLARANVALLDGRATPRGRVTITNGLEPDYDTLTERMAASYRGPRQGYGAISVVVDGPDPEDCLHCLGTFGAALAANGRKVVELSGRARPVRVVAA